MEKLVTSNLKLGIIAGGQLGKMIIQEASKWDIRTFVLDPDEHCPAGSIATGVVTGNPRDFDSVYQFGKQVDLLTFEIENIHIGALRQLKAEGLKIVPDPEILALIQDKGLQKEFYHKHGLPTASYRLCANKEEILRAVSTGHLTCPFVQKLRKGGYDGRGISVIQGECELENLLDGASVIEDKVRIDKEIAVIAARNKRGETKCFPTVEMVFNRRVNLVEKLICPADINGETMREAERIASRLIESLGMSGLLAVEFFLDDKGDLFINEVSPRPHNSGHHTIESVMTSQFEQHLRAILNLPLGSTHLKMPAVMLNLLGAQGHSGPVKYEGLTESLAIAGVKIHVYGKKLTKPFRKMGHVTILSQNRHEAVEKADKVQQLIKVGSWDAHA